MAPVTALLFAIKTFDLSMPLILLGNDSQSYARSLWPPDFKFNLSLSYMNYWPSRKPASLHTCLEPSSDNHSDQTDTMLSLWECHGPVLSVLEFAAIHWVACRRDHSQCTLGTVAWCTVAKLAFSTQCIRGRPRSAEHCTQP